MDNQQLTQQATQQATPILKEDKEIKEDINIKAEGLLKNFFEKYNVELSAKFGAIDTNNKLLISNLVKLLLKYDARTWQVWFDQCKTSDFLNGRTKKQFKPNLNWLIYPTNFEKIINYNYKSTAKQQNNNKTQQTQVKAKVIQNKRPVINKGKCIPMPSTFKRI